jgi:hypothetical protein
VNAVLLGSDWQTPNDLIAPDARIIGPSGFIIDRDTWIGVHKQRDYQQVRLEVTETGVHTYDKAGIWFDVVESECTYKGETIAGHFRGHPGLGHRPRQMAARRRAVHLPP